jgi:hypothetical protein
MDLARTVVTKSGYGFASGIQDEASSIGCGGDCEGADAGRPDSRFCRGNRGRSIVPSSAAERRAFI